LNDSRGILRFGKGIYEGIYGGSEGIYGRVQVIYGRKVVFAGGSSDRWYLHKSGTRTKRIMRIKAHLRPVLRIPFLPESFQ
jgi:hypothetical protein